MDCNRKLETLEALKKTFKKLDHDVNVQEFMGTSHWTEFDKISNVDQLGQMENSLRESLNQIRTRKFNEMNIPFRMSVEQQLQPLSWIANDDNHNIVLPEDSNMFLHKDVEGSTSSSFGSHVSYLGSSIKNDMSNSAQENGVLSDMSNTAPMRLQLNGHFPYLPYNFNLPNNLKFQPTAEINPYENPVDYHVNGGFEAPRSGYDSNNHHDWASTSGPCGVTMFDEQLYAQASSTKMNFGFI
ncbi:hypothetical protein JHK82_019582 [Glycine max]|nr:hypothetical protein JHK85_020022 [Glycine max]KAG5038757.1 hypothetical protein JHK86_019597 [Glycine max]KAG5143887.1 hypothetical protein JHK82_019582 [Glycine max]